MESRRVEARLAPPATVGCVTLRIRTKEGWYPIGASRNTGVARGHVDFGHLAQLRIRGHHQTVAELEDTQLMLEALFDIKAAVYEIHDVLIEPPEDSDEEEEDDA